VTTEAQRGATMVAETELRPGALKLPAVLMQSITHIAPAIAALFFVQFIVGSAGLAMPIGYPIGVFFVLLRPPLLAEDLRFLGRSSREIDEFMPQLRRWLRRVFTVLGGHAFAAGALTVFVAATGVRDLHPAAVAALAFTGAASIGLMAVVNFTIRSTFRWVLLAVTGLWVAATVAAMLS